MSSSAVAGGSARQLASHSQKLLSSQLSGDVNHPGIVSWVFGLFFCELFSNRLVICGLI